MMAKGADGNKQYDCEGDAAADSPEVALRQGRVDDALEVHAVVGGEEGEGEEDGSDAGEDEDGFVLGVGDDGEFVLFDGAELEELGDVEGVVLAFGKGGIGKKRGREERKRTAFMDCLDSIRSLSKHSC